MSKLECYRPITHGAILSLHESPDEAIGPPQQFIPPPGFAPHPTPPHVPHSEEQQVSALIIPNSQVGSDVAITHGAILSLHESPLAVIGPPQQLIPPPGFAPHPTPPHVPHPEEQQVSPSIIPNSQVGSDDVGGVGVGGVGVGGVGVGGVGVGVGGVGVGESHVQ